MKNALFIFTLFFTSYAQAQDNTDKPFDIGSKVPLAVHPEAGNLVIGAYFESNDHARLAATCKNRLDYVIKNNKAWNQEEGSSSCSGGFYIFLYGSNQDTVLPIRIVGYFKDAVYEGPLTSLFSGHMHDNKDRLSPADWQAKLNAAGKGTSNDYTGPGIQSRDGNSILYSICHERNPDNTCNSYQFYLADPSAADKSIVAHYPASGVIDAKTADEKFNALWSGDKIVVKNNSDADYDFTVTENAYAGDDPEIFYSILGTGAFVTLFTGVGFSGHANEERISLSKDAAGLQGYQLSNPNFPTTQSAWRASDDYRGAGIVEYNHQKAENCINCTEFYKNPQSAVQYIENASNAGTNDYNTVKNYQKSVRNEQIAWVSFGGTVVGTLIGPIIADTVKDIYLLLRTAFIKANNYTATNENRASLKHAWGSLLHSKAKSITPQKTVKVNDTLYNAILASVQATPAAQ